ncbi:hypothetical protein SAMN04488030_0037 [Aliiroseovarius halocynthiae]|uniref:Uncharacterized protein n=1 Tax=Aliiroseovarius halocynthiae TaxID=985055 RepID=A0A545SLD3_9RHOB|nr:hypothetical protein [Aliiroseovarius halocynthiae]TQV65793.1 hypothetical protein FIL88_15970 [Aliiroseovarius halocynthiae]SMR83560.1 hypothetical protein SAMN04488030_0037 [Aliiroseovarius halocynthiae]
MRVRNRDENTGRIGGFLYGLCALSGDLREYEGSAYSLEMNPEDHDIGAAINAFFCGQYEFSFTLVEDLEDRLGELEKRVGRYMLPDLRFGSEEFVSGMRGYLAFRLMDMINDVFDEFPLCASVTHLRHRSNSVEADFFGIMSGKRLLVLQFNKYVARQFAD